MPPNLDLNYFKNVVKMYFEQKSVPLLLILASLLATLTGRIVLANEVTTTDKPTVFSISGALCGLTLKGYQPGRIKSIDGQFVPFAYDIKRLRSRARSASSIIRKIKLRKQIRKLSKLAKAQMPYCKNSNLGVTGTVPTIVSSTPPVVISSTETPTRTIMPQTLTPTKTASTAAPTVPATATPSKTTESKTPSATSTRTPSSTRTATDTQTSTPTASASNTATTTSTNTATNTPTNTSTTTPTNTSTNTPTNTSTNTPSNTPDPDPMASHALMINDLSVVDDLGRTSDMCDPSSNAPTGVLPVWSFGRLMSDISGNLSADASEKFVRDWLVLWTQQTSVINGDSVAARTAVITEILNVWPKLSNGRLNLRLAPFKLLAIVYRPDLTTNSAGEGRFVFGLLGRNSSGDCISRRMTVILEYNLPLTSSDRCQSIKDWALRFNDLISINFGQNFNSSLENVTDDFASPGRGVGRANGSSLAQIRTGEDVLGTPWQMREFRLTGSAISGVPLSPVTVKLNPADSMNNTITLGNFLNTIPFVFPPNGMKAEIPTNFVWNAPNLDSNNLVSSEARREMAIKTCNGCHSMNETGTGFVHLKPRIRGEISSISGFLTGISMADPVNPRLEPKTFDALEERKTLMTSLLTQSCP